MRAILVWAVGCVLCVAGRGVAQESAAGVPRVDVFVSGEGGYHTFRIPAIVRVGSGEGEGTLLAFAEGRRGGRGDAGDIDLVLRRSEDGGRTWGEMAVVWDDGPNTCGNPCPVVDEATGMVHLLVTHNLGHDTEREIIDGASEGSRTVWVLSSADAGLTWGEPREISAGVKRPDWTWYATGPGNGVCLRWGEHAGRLVVPCDHIEAGSKAYYSHVIVSDDHGATWRIGGVTPSDQVNECAVAEIGADRLLLNMRNYDRRERARALSVSEDGGGSWGALWREAGLPEPICQASMIALGDGGVLAGGAGFEPPTLVFSNPASSEGRVRMTVRTSGDGGATWSEGVVLHEGPSAYSSLVDLGERSVGCLYERGEGQPYEGIVFAVLRLE
ncbi:MAG: exo-alpha-sialidase [Phycisphaerales bacterium JB054]